MSTTETKVGLPAVNCSCKKLVPLEEIKPNPQNPNKHPTEQIELLAKLIQRHGWRTPITVSNRSGFIVRGHGRFLAAKHLGLPTAPVDYQDYDTKEQELSDLLADNKIAELAEMDYKDVAAILGELPKELLDFTGFRGFEVDQILQADWTPPAAEELPNTDGEFVKFIVTREQAVIINQAIEKVRSAENENVKGGEVKEGRALELICADYLAK